MLTVTATRPEPDGSVIAIAHAPTRAAPLPRATLELSDHATRICTDQSRGAGPRGVGRRPRAPGAPADRGRVHRHPGRGETRIRGEAGIGGYVALRFGYRVEGLPAPFAEADLATLSESLQRPIREASIPAPIGPSALGPDPLVELDFSPAEARRILERLEFHFTPKHASWLNMVEIEIGVMVSQCLDRRIPDKKTLIAEVAAWERRRTAAGAKIDWMFTIERARQKLGPSYPSPSRQPVQAAA